MLGNTRLVFVPVLCAALPRLAPAARARDRGRRGARARRRGGRRRAVARPQQGPASAASRSRPTAARCGRRTTRRRTACSRSGQWIDDVAPNSPRPPAPNQLTPEDAYGYYDEARRAAIVRARALSERVRRDVVLRAPRDRSTWSDHPGEQGEARGAVGAAALAAERVRDERAARRRHAASTSAAASPSPRTCACSTCSRSPGSSSRRARSSRSRCCCSRTRRACARRLRRRDALPRRVGLPARAARDGGARSAAASGGSERRTSMRVVHVHRIRGIGGSERHLLDAAAGARRARHRAGVRRARRPGLGRRRLLRRAARAGDAHPVAARPRPAAARAARALAPRRRRAHASRARRRLRRRRGEAARRARSSRRSTTTIRSGSARSATSSAGSRALPTASSTITDSLRRFTVERVGVPAAKVETIHYGLDDLPAPWGENPPDDVPDGARVLLAVARLTPQKGIDVAVRALAAAARTTRCSSCSARARSATRSRRSRASSASSSRVFLPGRVPDVAAWLRRATRARASGALGGLRPRRARGDARRPAGRRDERQLAAGARRRRRDGLPRAPDDPAALALGVARALEQPELGARAAGARRVLVADGRPNPALRDAGRVRSKARDERRRVIASATAPCSSRDERHRCVGSRRAGRPRVTSTRSSRGSERERTAASVDRRDEVEDDLLRRVRRACADAADRRAGDGPSAATGSGGAYVFRSPTPNVAPWGTRRRASSIMRVLTSMPSRTYPSATRTSERPPSAHPSSRIFAPGRSLPPSAATTSARRR